MNEQLRSGTDGVRGRAELFTPEYLSRFGEAAVHVLETGVVYLGNDGRESAERITNDIQSHLQGLGVTCVDLGLNPTPLLALASEGGVAGVMITASHNLAEDNGLKVFFDGKKLNDLQWEELQQTIEGDTTVSLPGRGASKLLTGERLAEQYLKNVKRSVASLYSSLEGVTLPDIVMDCANGAMSSLAPATYRRIGEYSDTFGLNLGVVNSHPDGRNINKNCGSMHPQALGEVVAADGYALGLAFDGDGDRVVAVDELGREVNGDRIIALLALRLKSLGRLANNTVVVTEMTNGGFVEAMNTSGINVVRTDVGDKHVLAAMEQGGYSLGGEQSGHIIMSDHSKTGDGLLAGIHLALLAADSELPFSQLADKVMEEYPQKLGAITCSDQGEKDRVLEMLKARLASMKLERGERVNIRPSGTEPKVRVMVESTDAERVEEIYNSLVSVAAS